MYKRIYMILLLFVFVMAAIQCYAEEPLRYIGGGPQGWDGWKSTGDGWKTTNQERLGNIFPKTVHFESSETGVGALRSPDFVVKGGMIRFAAGGWNGWENDSSSAFHLKNSADGKILRSVDPPQMNEFSTYEWYVRDLIGKKVYFEASDECNEAGFAWLSLSYVQEISLGKTSDDHKYALIPINKNSYGAWGILSHDAVKRPAEPYLSSLITSGESSVGIIRTPDFIVNASSIKIMAMGWDGNDGSANKNRIELVESSTQKVLSTLSPPLSDIPSPISFDTSNILGKKVFLRFVDANSDIQFAWMGIHSIDAGDNFRIRLDAASKLKGWKSNAAPEALIEQFGIPFLTNMKSAFMDEVKLGIEAKRLLLLGMNVPDDSWYWIGDKLGEISVRYRDGSIDRYPLIVGESLWWGKRFDLYQEPFTNFADARKAFKDSINLYPQKPVSNGMYIASIETKKGGIIESVAIEPNPTSMQFGKIFGITAELSDNSKLYSRFSTAKGVVLDNSLLEFYSSKSLRKSNSNQDIAKNGTNTLRNIMYCTPENFPNDFAVDEVSGYTGPKISFDGDKYAKLVTNIFNHNADDMTYKVTDDGVYHTSTYDAAWYGYNGFGCFTLDENAPTRNHSGFYYDEAWTRDLGRTLLELISLGYTDKAKLCADWCLKMARIWEEGDSPDLLIDGKRLPRHIHRILQFPSTIVGAGCFENDGHGLTAMFIYNLWKRLPDRDEWLRSRWVDIKGLGDWVVWQLENKDISRATDVLWSDSEGSGWNITTGYSIYCDLPQIEALRGLTIMAESIGENETADKWRKVADGLKAAAEREYIEKDDKYGMTWTTKYAGFGLSSTLGPLILPSDLRGFKTESNYPEWYSYNEAAYQRIKDTFRLNAMGYGEGFIIQSALLLDKMSDAEELVKLTAKAIYNPTHRPYIVPENVAANEDNTVFCRMGDLGNGVQQAEILKAIRLMAGIDDADQTMLRIMPRIPKSWNKAVVKEMPALIGNDGEWVNSKISYDLDIKRDSAMMTINSDKELQGLSLRLGPFDPKLLKEPSDGNNIAQANAEEAYREPEITVNGAKHNGQLIMSGDSHWIWITISEANNKYAVEVKM